jgi:hypothetical protein
MLYRVYKKHGKERPMGEIIHRSEIRITRVKGPTRKADKRKEAESAFEAYLPHCPAAQSVIDTIDISHGVTYEALA